MTKERVHCPDCGHKFTVQIKGVKTRSIGVKARRVTGNQFEYSVAAPEAMIESGRFYSTSDDLLLSGALGASVGIAAGFIASVTAPDYTPQIIGLGASLGASLAWGWLCAEHNQRLKCVLPWFVEQRAAWNTGKQMAVSSAIDLTVDHRNRDGNTEVGRTINRFGGLPVDVDRFNEWAQGALIGKSLAVSNWTPKAKGFTRPEYDQLLTKLKAGGIIVNLGSNKGNTLTGGGRRALTRHLEGFGIAPPTTPEIDFLGERLAQVAKNNGGNVPLPRSKVYAGGKNGS